MVNPKSLQSLCIKSIIDNIDQFCAAYRIEKYATLQYYLQFIQKKCSHEILMNLASERDLRNKHLDFLINKYTKVFDFQIFQGTCDYILVIDRLKEVGSGIRKASMSGEKNCQTVNKVLNCLTSVEVLELSHTKCGDDSLRIIAENSLNLKCLDLFGCTRVTDKGLNILFHCTSLQSLNVEQTSVSHKGVAKLLKQVPSLRILKYENVPQAIFEALGLNGSANDNQVDHNEKFNLTRINIYNNPLRPESHLTLVLKVCTTFCPKIKDVLVTDLISKEQLVLCSLFENLETVSIGCSFLAENNCVNDFLRIRGANLKTLRLTSFSISLEVLARYCPNLESLSLESPTFQNVIETCTNKFVLPKLKILNLKSMSNDDDAIVALLISATPKLLELNLYRSHLSEIICDAIIKFPAEIQVINFSTSNVDVIFLQEILRTHHTLLKLIIDNTNITATQYDTLLDLADDLNCETDIIWTDFNEIVRNLFSDVDNVHRQIIKL